ncbi:MAG: LacI family DNA-binding transcriptional regulator [Pseudomonadota bacterium]
MGKPTVHDIAEEAGVSLATVDRVLNERPGVRSRTVVRVQDAIKKLGYVRDVHAANLARRRQYRFAFVLPSGQSQFLISLREAVKEAGAGLRLDRAELRTVDVTVNDSSLMANTLQRLVDDHVDGVAIMATETPVVRDMIARMKASGIAVVTLVSDQPNADRDHFVGIDNIAAGRTAGTLMGRFLSGRTGQILVIVSSTHARGQVERRLGFDAVLSEAFPNLTALPSLEGYDDGERTYAVVNRALDAHDDVVGIYGAGAGTRGMTRAIAERGLSDHLVIIGHDLTTHAEDGLRNGLIDVVINQNVGHLVRSATRILRAQCDGRTIIESQERIRIEIVLRENLP